MASGTRASLLDEASAIMADPLRPLDFAIILTLDPLNLAAFEKGALAAREAFPRTAARFEKGWWRPAETVPQTVEVARDDYKTLKAFLEKPLDPAVGPPLTQILLRGDRADRLVTRLHHAAGDALSLLSWLGHQLDVAQGGGPPVPAPLVLRTQAERCKVNSFAFDRPCDPLAARRPARSAGRRWLTRALDASESRARAEKGGDFTYNDLLAASVLLAARRWNTENGAVADAMGCWLPLNIRSVPFEGFGNGSSRVRLYLREATDDIEAVAKQVRQQLVHAREAGEWVVPRLPWLDLLPFAIRRAVMRRHFNRSGVDYGSIMFSHIERIALDESPWAPVRGIEAIAQIHDRYPFVVGAPTFRGITTMTVTYDPAQVDEADAAHFLDLVLAPL